MKGLLHSRRFKRILKKWLFMYVVAMLLITTVATYSKYVSSYSVSDQARVTKFHLIIDKIESNNSEYSQVSTIPYKFKVSTKDLEVNTFLVLSIYVNDAFKIVSVEDNQGRTIYDSGYEKTAERCFEKDECSYEDDNNFYDEVLRNKNENFIRLKRMVDVSDNDVITYTVNVRYNDNDSYLNDDIEFENVVQVGYSATQVRK